MHLVHLVHLVHDISSSPCDSPRMVSPFDSIEEVNSQLAACKAALLDLMQGKSVRLNLGGSDRLWASEDLDKLQNYIVFLSKERSKFLSKGRPSVVVGRPRR